MLDLLREYQLNLVDIISTKIGFNTLCWLQLIKEVYIMRQCKLAQVLVVFLLFSSCILGLENQIKQDLWFREQLESPLAQEVVKKSAKKSVDLLYIFSLKTVNRKKEKKEKKDE